MKTKTIQHDQFQGPANQGLRDAEDSKKHQSLSGEQAKISSRVGGPFTAWGAHQRHQSCLKARRTDRSSVAGDRLVA